MGNYVTRQDFEQSFQWKKFVCRTSPPLWRNLEHLGFVREALLKNNGYDMFISWKSELHLLFVNPVEHARVLEMLNAKARKNPNIFSENSTRCYKLCDDYLDFCTRYDSYKQFNNNELTDIFLTYLDKNNGMVAYRPLILMLDKINQNFLEEELSKVGSPEFRLEWITTTKALPFVHQRNDALAIGNEIAELGLSVSSELPELIESHIKQHIEKFGWLFTHHFLGDPMTRDDVLETVQKMQGGIYDPQKTAEENTVRKASLDKIKAINSAIARHIETAQDYAYLRTYRIDIANEADFHFRAFFNEVANRMSITYDDFLQLNADEIIKWLKGSIDTEYVKKTVRKRREYFVTYLVDDNKIYWFEGKENFIAESVKEQPKNLVLTGKVAQRGKVSGTVKVVYCKEEIEKVNDGDILVSPMTTPEMMIAIMKCAGIVTDEGGVACHAAQISREFSIPCVIGTLDASTLLHDGDTVEIIADGIDGTVKLLQS
jgi:phosphohistidine swiveling domain-containing protein